MRGERLCTVEDEWRPWLRLYLAILRQAAIDAKSGKAGAQIFLADALEEPDLVQRVLSKKRLPRYESSAKQAGETTGPHRSSESL